MRLGICMFTYANDFDLVNINLQHLLKLKEKYKGTHQIDIFILDDYNNPFKQPIEIESVNYAQTDFKRNGNLNGIDCVCGQLYSFNNIVSATKCDYVIKLDSDTVIKNFDFLDSRCDYIGFNPAVTTLYGYGSCYAFSSRLINLLTQLFPKLLQIETFCEQVKDVGEDYLFGYIISSFLMNNISLEIKPTDNVSSLNLFYDDPLYNDKCSVYTMRCGKKNIYYFRPSNVKEEVIKRMKKIIEKV